MKTVYILQEKSLSDTESLLFIRVYGTPEEAILYYVTLYVVDPYSMTLSFSAAERVDLQFGLTVFFKRSAFNGRYARVVTDVGRQVILDNKDLLIGPQIPQSDTVERHIGRA